MAFCVPSTAGTLPLACEAAVAGMQSRGCWCARLPLARALLHATRMRPPLDAATAYVRLTKRMAWAFGSMVDTADLCAHTAQYSAGKKKRKEEVEGRGREKKEGRKKGSNTSIPCTRKQRRRKEERGQHLYSLHEETEEVLCDGEEKGRRGEEKEEKGGKKRKGEEEKGKKGLQLWQLRLGQKKGKEEEEGRGIREEGEKGKKGLQLWQLRLGKKKGGREEERRRRRKRRMKRKRVAMAAVEERKGEKKEGLSR
ncbi:hypothetical protein BHE74_00041060 [Ensete ventricosum]|nr:hypothetical protein BHE74_00041060 [Ensete ventricosum]RZS17720.1 hypothetical protein BHM03_00049907 [Ensete ventricosum]